MKWGIDKMDKNIGKKYGRLEIIRFEYKDKNSLKYYNCKCTCGNYTTVYYGNLTMGHTKSCGCYQREAVIKNNRRIRKKIMDNIEFLETYFFFKNRFKTVFIYKALNRFVNKDKLVGWLVRSFNDR